jgi:hypothetical protein
MESEKDYLARRWRKLPDEVKRMLAASVEERAYLFMLWRLQYRRWLEGRDDPNLEEA